MRSLLQVSCEYNIAFEGFEGESRDHNMHACTYLKESGLDGEMVLDRRLGVKQGDIPTPRYELGNVLHPLWVLDPGRNSARRRSGGCFLLFIMTYS